MKTCIYKIAILLCMIVNVGIKGYAQNFTFIPRADVLSLIGCIEYGSPVTENVAGIPFYYSLKGYDSKEAIEKAKVEKLGAIALEVSPAAEHVETVDSVATRRATVYALDELDKSKSVGGFFSVEAPRLDKAMSVMNKHMNMFFSLTYGIEGAANTREIWDAKYRSLINGRRIADKERMTTVNRKKIYADLYNDTMKYIEELSELNQYFLSIQTLRNSVKCKPVEKVDKKAYITYAHSRWIAACQESKNSKRNN